MASTAGRITLQFNLNDTTQKYAYELLKTQGHRKSILISEALKFYMDNAKEIPQVKAVVSNFNAFQMKEILRAAIEELGPEGVASVISTAEPVKIPVKSDPVAPYTISSSVEQPVENAEEDDDIVDGLFDALDMFG